MSESQPKPDEGQKNQEFASDMGIRFLGNVDGAQVLELDLEQKHMSRANRAHGGVLFTLLDSALGRSILQHLPEGQGCATVEIKVNYFRPVQTGRIMAKAWMRELTKSLGYAEGEVLNEEGKTLAKASGTFFLTKTMRQEDRERV
jgi:acyl-CoA thioesterase